MFCNPFPQYYRHSNPNLFFGPNSMFFFTLLCSMALGGRTFNTDYANIYFANTFRLWAFFAQTLHRGRDGCLGQFNPLLLDMFQPLRVYEFLTITLLWPLPSFSGKFRRKFIRVTRLMSISAELHLCEQQNLNLPSRYPSFSTVERKSGEISVQHIMYSASRLNSIINNDIVFLLDKYFFVISSVIPFSAHKWESFEPIVQGWKECWTCEHTYWERRQTIKGLNHSVTRSPIENQKTGL